MSQLEREKNAISRYEFNGTRGMGYRKEGSVAKYFSSKKQKTWFRNKDLESHITTKLMR